MYQIITDSSIDLSQAQIEDLGLKVVPFYITLDGKEYHKEAVDLPVRSIYEFMVEHLDSYPKTSLPTVGDFCQIFEDTAKEGKDILCFTLDSRLSGSFNSARTAKTIIGEKYPDIRIEVMNSDMATLQFGIFMMELARYQKAGADFDTLYQRALEIQPTAQIFFSIENMKYLTHGGRAGKLLEGSTGLLNLRPLLLLHDGELHPAGFARGRQMAKKKILEKAMHYLSNAGKAPESYLFAVGFGYDMEEGHAFRLEFEKALKALWPDYVPEIVEGQIGATIGAYTGPHPIGLGFIEKSF